MGFNVSPSIETTTLAIKNQGSNYNVNQDSNNGKNFKGNTRKGKPLYSHCGKLGHIMKKFYKLVCYKLGYKQKGRPLMKKLKTIKYGSFNTMTSREKEIIARKVKITMGCTWKTIWKGEKTAGEQG